MYICMPIRRLNIIWRGLQNGVFGLSSRGLASSLVVMSAKDVWPSRKISCLPYRIGSPKAQQLAGKKVLVTAGGTVERLDPVRYLTNDSSGKMGFAIAEAAANRGADVTLIAARTSVDTLDGIRVIQVESAEEMLQAVLSRFDETDIVIKAAAVADYRPVTRAATKIKKNEDRLIIELERTTDILQTLGERKKRQFIVGFAAETEQIDHYAMDKLHEKTAT